jgi:hypothetical protein
MNHNLRQTGELRAQFFPKPSGHQFNGWIFQTWCVIEMGVVELFDNRTHRRADEGVVIKPTGFGIHFAFHRNFDFKSVAMNLRALVAWRHFGQALRGFDNKIFRETDLHKRVVITAHGNDPSSFYKKLRLSLLWEHLCEKFPALQI